MRILLVEDNPMLLRSVSRALKKSQFTVALAADGAEGLNKARNNEYDAIILDVMLPKLDGWLVLKELRKGKVNTPVLILTARDSVEDRVRGLNEGADDYLPKPFEMEELQARIRALLRRTTEEPRPEITIGELTLDLNAKRIQRIGEMVAITAQEYNLVEYLALHKGKVISRAELCEHLFDEDESNLSNTLDVKVSRIRSKLGKHVITTHRGLGYSIG